MELCDVCSQLDLGLDNHDVQYLGPYKEIEQKSRSLELGRNGCGGCAFFVDVLRNSDSWGHRLQELEGMVVNFYCLILDVRKPSKEKSGVSWSQSDLNFDLCTVEDVLDSEIDCRRPVIVDPSDPRCYGVAHSWLEDCTKHKTCNQAAPTRLPKRVIEIPADSTAAPRLLVTDVEQLGQYVVLSHCWGSLGPAKLIDELISQFQQGIPLEQLPRSFLDAITITRQLGFKYLWIDALCISQDNAADWAEEAPKMAYYYGQSALMIAATAAEDSSKGILSERHVPYSPIMGKEKKYYLRQQLLGWEWDIEYSILASRGWAAQERILAPRVLHYTKRQMIWECVEGLRFEASCIKGAVIDSGQVNMRSHKSKIQQFVTQGLNIAQSAYVKAESADSTNSMLPATEDSITRVHGWLQCVDNFSICKLTVSSDKLHAISGIASIMNHENQMGTYLAGLWSKHLAAGLTWSRTWALLTSPPEYRAPSWSWASLDGEVSATVLASPPELLNPPDTEMSKRWAKRFELEFVENGIKLQDPGNLYGPVLEESYIVVDCTCIRKNAFLALSNEKADWMSMAFDKSNAADCPCCGPPDPADMDEDEVDSKAASTQEADDSVDERFGRRKPPEDPSDAHFDVAMYVISDASYKTEGFVDLVLLTWVDEEKRVARRFGFARMNINQEEEEMETFRETFMEGDWERMRIKFV
ncbi:heterokaryon incompatibility protein-domain-containing protein [Phaeosphaeria sp. MPI-PUGE-AT-0046c]|nr:heterokaryon incompatibility protein-domain-containing protein [Phaeosphaeria sp. MPI-PUGE-AT-0046c]